jgi:DNA-binding transcriptional ArsR family regulator
VGGPFINGKLPLDWLARVFALKSLSAVGVARALFYKRGLEGSNRDLPLTNVCLKHFGVSRAAKSRALSKLEAAGLVRVERKPGRSPRVTLLFGGPGTVPVGAMAVPGADHDRPTGCA